MTTSYGTNISDQRRSGQALTEAVITLCLLSFTWLVTAYMLTLAENRVRCAAIGRHSAWMQAHNPGPLDSGADPNQSASLTTFFVRHKATVKVPPPPAEESDRSVDLSVTGTQAFTLSVLNQLSLNPVRIQRKSQTLNILNPDTTALKKVDQREVPFMRGVFSRVSSLGIATCEWVQVETLLEDEDEVKTALGLPPVAGP